MLIHSVAGLCMQWQYVITVPPGVLTHTHIAYTVHIGNLPSLSMYHFFSLPMALMTVLSLVICLDKELSQLLVTVHIYRSLYTHGIDHAGRPAIYNMPLERTCTICNVSRLATTDTKITPPKSHQWL